MVEKQIGTGSPEEISALRRASLRGSWPALSAADPTLDHYIEQIQISGPSRNG
jgi:hypothetical protein